MELFKKSFALYIESGMRKKMEADIDRMVAENQSGHPVTEEFNEMFGKTIIEHYLCKFHCFYLSSKSLIYLTTFFT